jgi:hypothetical protein
MSDSKPNPKRSSRAPRRARGIRESLVAIVLGFEAIVVGLGALTMLGLKSITVFGEEGVVAGGCPRLRRTPGPQATARAKAHLPAFGSFGE